MVTLRFKTVPGITPLVVNMYDVDGASTGSTNNACTELVTGLYTSSVTGSGIVYVVASKGAFKATGWADLSNVVGGFVEVCNTYSEAAGDLVDETAIAAKVYQKLAGSSVALLDAPASGDPLDSVLYGDFSLRAPAAVASSSTIVVEIRGSLKSTIADISADSADGLLELLGNAVTGGDAENASVTRVDASNVDIWIAASVFSQLDPGTYHLEVKELAADETVSPRYEVDLIVRRSAARRIA